MGTFTLKGPQGLSSITVTTEDERVLEVDFTEDDPREPVEKFDLKLKDALEAYLRGEGPLPHFPVAPRGTEFQMKIWKGLQEIPYGETMTYGQMAETYHRKGSARAVGGACNKNPISILIPCHRVVGKQGLTGFGGGLEWKEYLLQMEKNHKK
ncbi:MAG: methylated-DNA--[protein]-cysteine S-methyltransferase [Tissierellia bacterium]|nr:methylated-DNA--[protein]-cysteine S-methyltransferase [Tissierellia bacterium]